MRTLLSFRKGVIMTELYEKRNRSDLEYRLVILCCLKELGIVTMEQLWPFIARLNLMEYMQMCVFLRQLQQDGYAAEGAGSIQGALYITDTGINLLQVLGDKIPHSDRTKIQSEAPAYLGLLREALTARAVYHTGPDNAYTAKCAITDGDLPAFWADAQKAKDLLGWEAKHTVEDMCRSAWLFAKNN
jgi:hypothetical protein